jgi:hypothetical protein
MWGNDHMKLTHLSRFRVVPPTAVKCFVHHIVDKAQPSHTVQSCKQVWSQSFLFMKICQKETPIALVG